MIWQYSPVLPRSNVVLKGKPVRNDERLTHARYFRKQTFRAAKSGRKLMAAQAEKQPFLWVLVIISTAQGSQKQHLIMATTAPNP